MEYEQIRYETRDQVALITLDRPDRLNAWTWQMQRELAHAIRAANDDGGVGAIVLTGAGRGFCAGADVRDSFQRGIDAQDSGARAERDDTNWIELVRTAKPLIAAVNGAAVGVGLTMILPFDVLIAGEQARFGMFFIKMGLVPELASTYFLTQRIGFGQASEMCLSGRLYGAEEAGRIGLVNRVVPQEQLLEEALATGRLLAANPDPQLRWIKEMITRNATNADYNAVMAMEDELFARATRSPEHREAVAAFQEKRTPQFR